MNYVLRYGPLVAAFALGLGAVLEPLIPGYTGIVAKALQMLGVLGVGPDQDLVSMLAAFSAGVMALIGVARKTWKIVRPYFHPMER